MRKLMQWFGCAALVAAAGLATVPAGAEQMYSWTTEDGVYAFSDDPKKVPSRYRGTMEVVARRQLGDYERFTEKDARASEQYAARMAKRLGKLRALNAVHPAMTDSPAPQTAGQRINLPTGREGTPSLNLATDSQEPIVIEPLFTKRPGDSVTRRTTVVTQGDRTLAIVKGTRHHRNPIHDVIDERDL